jgi:Na+-transporting methylmalonyl-CoA/oxaloacetate decarboxylase gamma subunit
METYSSAFVCLMGIGTVFFGLICLVLLTKLMSLLCGAGQQAVPAAVPAVPIVEPDRTELIAAVSAAIAEDLGTDITGIRILSVKKL